LAEKREDRNEGDELKAFKELQVRLCVSTNRGECVDFSDSTERHGYITECLRSRAGYCASLLAHSKCSGVDAVRRLLLSNNTSTLSVSAIGEGPGFSAVGIAAFLLFYGDETTEPKSLNFACCDYEEGWAPSVQQMGQVIGRANSAIRDINFQLHLSFRFCDVRYGLDHEKNSRLVAATEGKLADLFIFSFVLVENAQQLRSMNWQFVTELLDGAGAPEDEAQIDEKPRAALVIDSTHRIFPEIHDALGGNKGASDGDNDALKTAEEGGAHTPGTRSQWSAHLPADKGPSIPRNKLVLLNAAARSMADGQQDWADTDMQLGYHCTQLAESLDMQFEQMRIQSSRQANWQRQNPEADSGAVESTGNTAEDSGTVESTENTAEDSGTVESTGNTAGDSGTVASTGKTAEDSCSNVL
jgi:hypothetical protein